LAQGHCDGRDRDLHSNADLHPYSYPHADRIALGSISFANSFPYAYTDIHAYHDENGYAGNRAKVIVNNRSAAPKGHQQHPYIHPHPYRNMVLAYRYVDAYSK